MFHRGTGQRQGQGLVVQPPGVQLRSPLACQGRPQLMAIIRYFPAPEPPEPPEPPEREPELPEPEPPEPEPALPELKPPEPEPPTRPEPEPRLELKPEPPARAGPAEAVERLTLAGPEALALPKLAEAPPGEPVTPLGELGRLVEELGTVLELFGTVFAEAVPPWGKIAPPPLGKVGPPEVL